MNDLRVSARPNLARLVAAATLLLAACGPTAASSPTAAPKPTTASAATTAANPSASPSAAANLSASPVTSASPAASPAAAAPTYDEKAVADFYRGKTIRLIVGFGAGGGYDTYSRLVAKYISKYLPGNPTVIVENLPGAGSKLAISQIANALPKDGTVIGIGDGGLAETQILTPGDFDFEFKNLSWVGAPSIFEYILFITKASADRAGVTKFEDVLGPNGKQLILGVTGTGLDYVTQSLMRDVMGANIKSVSGYAGSAAIRLAMDSGEVDGYTNGWDSIHATNDADIMNGNWKLLVQMTDHQITQVPASLPKMPLWLDFAKNDEDKQLLRQGGSQLQTFGRAYFMAPGVPADRLAAVQDAFMKTMADPDLKADAEKANLEINPLSGAQVQSVVNDFVSMPENLKARLKTILKL
jgi:tripartite-type tricarboxylate transporter receptor subunit TctC